MQKTYNSTWDRARDLVKHNKIKEACDALDLCIALYAQRYNECRATDTMSAIKARKMCEDAVAIKNELIENGITDKVKAYFDWDKEQRTQTVTKQSDGIGWLAELFKAQLHSVVEISTRFAGGTGFIISSKGYLLTNRHVVEDVDTATAKYSDAIGGGEFKIKVVAVSDENADLALCSFSIKESGEVKPVKRIASYDKSVVPGMDVGMIGNSLGDGLSPIGGRVRYAKHHGVNLACDMGSNHGDSGSPIFNNRGECIGINKAKLTRKNDEKVDAWELATPMDKIEELLKKWMDEYNLDLATDIK